MKDLHDLVAVREELCFRRLDIRRMSLGIFLGRRSGAMTLKSEDLPEDGYCVATRNWLVRKNELCGVYLSCPKGGNSEGGALLTFFKQASFREIAEAFLNAAHKGTQPPSAAQNGGERMESKGSKGNKKALILGGIALAALIAVFGVIYSVFREKPVEGTKSISIEVVNKAQETTKYDLTTNAEYLRQAMEEADGLTFSGTESAEFGIMVDTVNGETADWNVDASYWSFYVNGDYCNYGIDTQPVEDGDAFSIVYTISE